ncbi:MAG TPA: hypothetical protein VG870_14200 [Chitinophagaceae bacterium]|nr:hypothetical protein [Chitinophagaceae bacterium]
MRLLCLLPLACLVSLSLTAQDRALGIFQDHTDVGKPALAGSARYEAGSQTYFLKGSGYNIWFNRDEFQFAYRKIAGDFILTANFQFAGDSGNAHRKIGWMIRESLDPEAAQICGVVHGDGLTVLQWRGLRGAYMRDPQDEIRAAKQGPEILQLERSGKTITLRVAHPGEPLQTVGSHMLPDMPDSVLAGLFICSHDPDRYEEARIWNVRIDRPVPENYDAGRLGELGSRLEILDVFAGTRRVIYQSATHFEAPNYLPGGQTLLFNQQGGLYTIPVEGGVPVKLNTGFADRVNNDHGISFDGKMLAMSSGRSDQPHSQSAVYVLPLAGGTPKLLTPSTPSYWHGWNPNGKDVLFVGMRDGKVYNIYRVPVSGGSEVALTHNRTGHVDGPEYSPDGKYIYYNANPTGTMQLWRMKPDGSAPEQLTFDEYNNWFPHISPDGKWIVFISFPADIDPMAHPAYKRVMLRLMPAAGGAPRVIAYLYGGQGTINVPSWSPDNRHIAFVSNSEAPGSGQ